MFRKHIKLVFGRKTSDNTDNTQTRKSLSTTSQDAASRISPGDPSPRGSSIESNFKDLPTSCQSTSSSAPSDSSPPPKAASSDPLGLKVVHRPAGERRADIVFVHGLGGSSRKTWSYNRDPDLFWPLAFLPSEPDINETRILTFGYNANFLSGSGRNTVSVLDFAKDLLYDLKYSQDETVPKLEGLRMGERPIIFIVHSMGGLVVKEAYMQGQSDPAYDSIIQAISAIIFLSTPHRGTNLAKTLNGILQASFINRPMQFISELAAGSQTLQRLNEQFRHVAPRLDIVSFYETRPTPVAGFKKSQMMVLGKDSSVLGYPGEISKPLDADHHGVCKYASPSDPCYISVRDELKSLVGKITLGEDEPTSTKKAVRGVAEYLSVSESPDADYNFFRDRWTPGTCSWILTHDVFTAWMDGNDTKPRMLWLQGNAASGKSVLSSFLINTLVERGVLCHHYFIRFMSQEKRGMSMMLRSLAYQVANSTPAYADKLQQLAEVGTELKTADYRNVWQLLFKQTLFQLSQPMKPLYLVIDGIDEADHPSSLLKLFGDLHFTSLPIRILMISRNTHEISSSFQKLSKQVNTGTIRVEGNPVDFRAYIDHEMDLGGDAGYREHVTSQLLDRANGNFLWIHLAVQRINSCHTKLDVENALMELPSGMEALYDRMAFSVEAASNASNRRLGETILGWATCAQRLLTVQELGDALGNESGVLEIHRTIADLCGGFVTVDHEGRVAMIHETAREYLTRGSEKGRSLIIDPRPTNDMLLRRCVERLTDATLRSQVNRGEPPPILDYAATFWPHHLALWSALTSPGLLEVIAKFLKGPHILTWIYLVAKSGHLRTLVVASRHLADLSTKLRRGRNGDESVITRQIATVFEGWATDLVKILGKFGSNLRSHPESIYRLIPPFCPEDSMIYRQFGRKESRALHVSGFTTTGWDDCLARFSLTPGAVASSIITAGGRIALLSVTRNTSQIIIYSSSTFEEQRRIAHPERVLSIQANKLGDMVVSYGYETTRVWDVVSGDCVKTIKNPRKRPRPHCIMFSEKQNAVFVCGEDRCIRVCSLDGGMDSAEWTLHSQIDEERLSDTIVNFPVCSAFSPDGNMLAFGYRNHPLTVWELDPPMLLGQCYVRLHEPDMTVQKKAWGEVFRVAWHPLSGEVFGLTQIGMLFRWDPHEEETSATVQAGGKSLSLNQDGSLVATGDGVGTIKVFATADFSRLYQLSSQGGIASLSFSADSRRIYDIRGSYGNVWEPNTLVRLADCPDHSSDTNSETESLAKSSLLLEHHSARVDGVISLAGQPFGPLYCYGTENGVATLCEAGKGKVCEVARLVSYTPIKHVAWSGDGSLVALADQSGKISIKRVTKSGEAKDTWEASNEFEVVISPEDGNVIRQLIFHPSDNKLFVATPVKVFRVDITSQTVTQSVLELGSTSALKVKWACHPTKPDTLLGFGNTKVHVFTWTELRQASEHAYFPPRLGRASTVSMPSSGYARVGSFQQDTETLGRLITNVDSPEILLEISSETSTGRVERQYLIFDMNNLQLEELGLGNPNILPYSAVAPDMASGIREPLAILSQRRLVFLAGDRWICTWRMPLKAGEAGEPRRGELPAIGESIAKGVEKHYFVPGDWMAGRGTRLCTVTPDGKLLCPHNGDVIAVQSSRLI